MTFQLHNLSSLLLTMFKWHIPRSSHMEYLRQALDHFNKRMVKIFSYLHEIDHEY